MGQSTWGGARTEGSAERKWLGLGAILALVQGKGPCNFWLEMKFGTLETSLLPLREQKYREKKENKQTNNLKHLIQYFLRVQAGAMQFLARLPNFISAAASLLHQCIRSFWKSSLFTCTTQMITCCEGASLLHQCIHSFGSLHSSHAQHRSLSAVQGPAFFIRVLTALEDFTLHMHHEDNYLLHQCTDSFRRDFTLHMHNEDNYLLYRGQPSSSVYWQL